MNKSDLTSYINSNLKRGFNIEEIKQQLLSRGFSDYDINEAILTSNYEEPIKEEQKKKVEKIESITDWDKGLEE
ncbi:hypothetical protein COU58_01465 [Candidatus Pacearchaeota archaeon CG10_big_fil_rev_8_21_14_0_10_32_42]|nr:MAG: hypothetical protein COU58_01465 [Candidatus Pacearchaeota archaeon CG10_big_fil_rev_8_21_14_0_10_32_42]